ncbi:MAG TPA: glycosyltransferase, partial [Gammaproteobacteria bacterium]|nr:glycosyltransferase [Gammaproteobacteria bacterium]
MRAQMVTWSCSPGAVLAQKNRKKLTYMASILFMTTRIPYPPWEGHQIRTFNLLKAACSRHDVHLLSFVRREEDVSHAAILRDMCTSVELVDIPLERNRLLFLLDLLKGIATEQPFVVRKYRASCMEETMCRQIERCSPDLIHIDMLPLAQYMPLAKGRSVVLNEHNVESLLVQRRAEGYRSLPHRLFFSAQARKLRRFETWACRRAARILACSPDDAATLQKMAGVRSVEVVANGVDVDYFAPSETPEHDPNNIVFVGSMAWFPNRDGIEFFLQQVMPLVRRRIPEATFTIVGKTDSLAVPAGLRENVTLTGFVEDLRPWVRRAGVYVVPLRVGSGTRLKLLEAMAMAKPIVSTTIGCEGVAVEHGRELLIADEARHMAQAICQLMEDRELALRLAHNARNRAVERYDWEQLGGQLLDLYQEVLQQ